MHSLSLEHSVSQRLGSCFSGVTMMTTKKNNKKQKVNHEPVKAMVETPARPIKMCIRKPQRFDTSETVPKQPWCQKRPHVPVAKQRGRHIRAPFSVYPRHRLHRRRRVRTPWRRRVLGQLPAIHSFQREPPWLPQTMVVHESCVHKKELKTESVCIYLRQDGQCVNGG